MTAVAPAPANRTFSVPQDGLPWQGSKTPEEIPDFSFDWSAEIGADTIATSTWELESGDIVNHQSGLDTGNTIATILISNGVPANIYNVTNFITTLSGIKLDATFRLFINQYNYGCS